MKKAGKICAVLLTLGVLLSIFPALSRLENGHRAEDRQLLEDALRRAAVTCYACEGFYPPDIAYMRQHYGISYDTRRYQVYYELFASNLMPDITVLENTYGEYESP